MKTFIAYSNKSCVTGKALREALHAKRKKTDKKAKCNLLVRWGNTEQYPNLRATRELNSIESVKLATNKLAMLQALSKAEVATLQFNTDPALIAQYLDKSGNHYIRNKRGVVRYGNDFNPTTDSYYSKPVPFKRREYRVHVFCGKVIGIYEKVPLKEGAENRPKLFKSDTCRFVRCDETLSRVDQAAQALCIASVTALGLDFGGVDLIRDNKKQFFVCEVNSAPGLNGLNVDRWVAEIKALSGV